MPWSQRELIVNGRSLPYHLHSAFPSIATLPGLPATAFPAGRSSEGMPIGLQAIGPYLEDYTPIRFAELVTERWGGFEAPPGY
jgi:amidase